MNIAFRNAPTIIAAMRELEVVGAAIRRGDAILCARRSDDAKELPRKWEFPGGKIENGETAPQALVREIQEELACEITVGKHIVTASYHYAFAHVRLAVYYATMTAGSPMLHAHSELRWQPIAILDQLDWAPVDIAAVQKIMATAG